MLHMNGNYLFASIQVYEPRHFIVLKPPHPEPANNKKKELITLYLSSSKNIFMYRNFSISLV